MPGYKKDSNRLPPFVALTWKMLNSPAYKELNHSSAKALPYFLGKIKGTYNDPQRYLIEFIFSYSEGKRYGFSPATFSKSIKELMSMGFIDPVDKGGLRSDGRSYNIFKLSKRWENFGRKDFQSIDWKCFQPRKNRKLLQKGNATASVNGVE